MTNNLINFLDILITEGYTILRITENETIGVDYNERYSWWICEEFRTVGKIEEEDFNFNTVRGIEITEFIPKLNLNHDRVTLLGLFQNFIEKFENNSISMDFSHNTKWKKYKK